MSRLTHILAGPVIATGLCLLAPLPASAQILGAVSPRVSDLQLGLFCAPPEGGRRPAPDTMSGWIHIPEEPVQMRMEGTTAPAVLGLGFGVRFRIDGAGMATARYSMTHPPMPPSGITVQRWESTIGGDGGDSVFFQFDVPEELQTGDWTFTVELDGEVAFSALFTVVPPSEMPGVAQMCEGGAMLSSLSSQAPAAAG